MDTHRNNIVCLKVLLFWDPPVVFWYILVAHTSKVSGDVDVVGYTSETW